MKPLVIYHKKCPDGFGAAYAAWRKYGDAADYVPAAHGAYPTLDELKVDGREVYIVDFSFPRATLEAMAARAKRVVILDHHKTAEADLANFPGAIFDMNRSGARLAWEFFHPGTPVPQLLVHIEDRDLYDWNLADTEPLMMYLDTLPFDFEAWHAFVTSPGTHQWQEALDAGRYMVKKFRSIVETVADTAEPVCFCGHQCHKVNLGTAHELASDVGNLVAERNGSLALLWYITKGKLRVSLRSKKGSVDVSELARKYGGGGHAGAAAFVLTLGTPQATQFFTYYIANSGQVEPK
jgi:oligoribonuclease NrnB/cAMP/cGMP phosphodiesterase (DHH superfamily)